MGDTYTCENCGGTFEKIQSDQEAMEEAVDLFGDLATGDLAVVCQDCFDDMRKAGLF